MSWLVGCLNDNDLHDALEYDLLSLGIDLLDLYRGGLSFRRLRVFVKGLPASSNFKTLLIQRQPLPEGEPEEYWEPIHYWMAEVIDSINTLIFVSQVSAAASGADWKKIDKKDWPQPIKRPGEKRVAKKAPEVKKLDPLQLLGFADQLNQGQVFEEMRAALEAEDLKQNSMTSRLNK